MKKETEKRDIDPEVFKKNLLDWYHNNKRTMPWREDPMPYHVWISEIMLQQTRVEAVAGYYLRFMERLPDVKSLSEIGEDELHKLWEGLGYYNRAKNLKKAAERLMREYEGKLPASYEELLKLPGIGPYTAGAIASIAFGKSVPAVDGNVMRVMARITGDSCDITKDVTRKKMEEKVRALLPDGEARDFNQALMELGALVCLPNGAPKCALCPMKEFCFARLTGRETEFPVKTAKKERRVEKKTVFLFVNEKGEVFLQKRGEKGLLSGLWEFPQAEGHFGEKEAEVFLKGQGINFLEVKKLPKAKHIFTHIEWRTEGFLVRMNTGKKPLFPVSSDSSFNILFKKEQVWCSLSDMKKVYGLPSAFKAYLSALEKEERKEADS